MFKTIFKIKIPLYYVIVLPILIVSCKKGITNNLIAVNKTYETPSISKITDNKTYTPEFKAYWYAGKAEITSYKLEQARYGELREGHAVLVYVTEDFLPEQQVKADKPNLNNIPILKLNATKNFNTGIYPYSIMQSTFFPVSNNKHAIKISSSIQEWCGHVYTQLNNKTDFNIVSHSYFESEADETFKINKAILENELWIKLRINPKSLPTGNLEIIPALEFTRLKHIPIKAYQATATLSTNTYTLTYPDLNRTLKITYNPEFPFEILNWEERFKSGYGAKAKMLTTKASRLKTIKSAYWHKNSNTNKVLRDTLLLN